MAGRMSKPRPQALDFGLASVQAPARIRLLNAEQVSDQFFGGSVTPRWVRLNVPGKRKYGHRTVLWMEHEVREWILSSPVTNSLDWQSHKGSLLLGRKS